MKNDKVIARFPIHKDLLHMILCDIKSYYGKKGQPYLAKLYMAMFSIAYFGLLRAGEVAEGPHSIVTGNVYVGTNKNKILLILNTSKTHGKGNHPQRIRINSLPLQLKYNTGTDKTLCPFKLLNEYSAIRPRARVKTDQFFVYRDHSRVTQDNLRKVLKSSLNRLHFKSSLYNLHSFHIGRCGDLYKLGISVETIKKIGRWKSNAVFNYLTIFNYQRLITFDLYLFAVNVEAFQDVWIVGDEFSLRGVLHCEHYRKQQKQRSCHNHFCIPALMCTFIT